MNSFDLNQPITNPDLVAALDALMQADTAATRQQVAVQLDWAIYLVAILDDELRPTPGDAPEQVMLQAGSRFGVLTADDGAGGQLLPIFTDWEAVRSWAARPVSALVMPAGDAWQFAVAGSYTGVLVNPAGQAVFLPLEVVARMSARRGGGPVPTTAA